MPAGGGFQIKLVRSGARLSGLARYMRGVGGAMSTATVWGCASRPSSRARARLALLACFTGCAKCRRGGLRMKGRTTSVRPGPTALARCHVNRPPPPPAPPPWRPQAPARAASRSTTSRRRAARAARAATTATARAARSWSWCRAIPRRRRRRRAAREVRARWLRVRRTARVLRCPAGRLRCAAGARPAAGPGRPAHPAVACGALCACRQCRRPALRRSAVRRVQPVRWPVSQRPAPAAAPAAPRRGRGGRGRGRGRGRRGRQARGRRQQAQARGQGDGGGCRPG